MLSSWKIPFRNISEELFKYFFLSDGPIIIYTFIGTQAPETKAFNPKRKDSLCIVNKKAKISPETI